jgi:hypothetical protein
MRRDRTCREGPHRARRDRRPAAACRTDRAGLADGQRATSPERAERQWAALDRELTDQAVWLATVTSTDTDLLEPRTGNYHHHAFLGPFIDQLWVR